MNKSQPIKETIAYVTLGFLSLAYEIFYVRVLCRSRVIEVGTRPISNLFYMTSSEQVLSHTFNPFLLADTALVAYIRYCDIIISTYFP